MGEILIHYLENDILFFLGFSILLGVICSTIIEKITKCLCAKNNPKSYDDTNVISEEHIQNCIYFNSDNGRPTDDVVKTLKGEKVDFQFSVDF